jgi:hypothetical protein
VWGVIFFASAFILAAFLSKIGTIAFVIGLIVIGSCISSLTATAEAVFVVRLYRHAVGQSTDPEFDGLFKKAA